MKPNFLFIGPDKSGSTWLYEILRQHPECYVPPIKDIYYFDKHYERGLNWYLSFFKHAELTHKAIGELSHDYLFSKTATDRIANDFPNIKMITCLRNPIERSFSNYLYLVRSGITRMSFEAALNSYPELLNNSCYYEYILEYFNRFDTKQIKVMFFDHLKSDPVSYAKEIFSFLGLTFIDSIEYNRKVIPASKPRSFILSFIVKYGADIARRIRMEDLVGKIQDSKLSKLLYIPYTSENKPRMSESTKSYLNSIFEKDIQNLQELLEKDLSHWLDPNSGMIQYKKNLIYP